jgi:hypothetical protein
MYIVFVKVATSLTPENCCLVGILLLDLDSWWNFFMAAPTRLSSRTHRFGEISALEQKRALSHHIIVDRRGLGPLDHRQFAPLSPLADI